MCMGQSHFYVQVRPLARIKGLKMLLEVGHAMPTNPLYAGLTLAGL